MVGGAGGGGGFRGGGKRVGGGRGYYLSRHNIIIRRVWRTRSLENSTFSAVKQKLRPARLLVRPKPDQPDRLLRP